MTSTSLRWRGAACCAAFVLLAAGVASARTVRGVVCADADGDGACGVGEPGVRAVVALGVSQFVDTDEHGQFALEVADGARDIVWVRVPDGYRPGPVWARVDGSARLELPLRPVRHHGPLRFVVASDTHLSPRQPFRDDLGPVLDDMVALEPAPAFFTILGDITQGNEDAHFDLVDAAVADVPVAYVPVPGNHDWYDGGETWFRRYGPDNYSFDIGGVHFVVWNMSMSEAEIRTYLGAELARVPDDMTIVALTHAPPIPSIVETLQQLGVDYVLSGHTHTNRILRHGGILELTTQPLLMGGLDFTPGGYRVVTIEGGTLSAYHRTVVEGPQLAVLAPSEHGCAAGAPVTAIVACEIDAGALELFASVDGGSPVAMTHAGAWTWRAELGTPAPGAHTLTVTARTASGQHATRTVPFEVCESALPVRAVGDGWPQLGRGGSHAGYLERALVLPLQARWAAPLGGHALHGPPVIDRGVVYATATDLGAGTTGSIVAYELSTGRLRWRHATPIPVRGGPVVAGDVVAFGEIDGTLVGLDAQTGAVRWRYELGTDLPPSASTVLATPTVDGTDLIYGHQRHVAVVDAATGQPRWSVEPVPDGQFGQVLAALAVAEDTVVGTFHRELGGLVAWDRATGRERWRRGGPEILAVNASPVIADGVVYVVNGMTDVLAIELATGRLGWHTRLDPDGFEWGHATVGAPALGQGVLVVPTLSRDLAALDAATGEILWRHAARAPAIRAAHYRGAGLPGFAASPVITGGIVWAIDTSGMVSALDLATGQALETLDLGVPVLAGPVVSGSWFVVASYDGTLHAFVGALRAPAGEPLDPLSVALIVIWTAAPRARGARRRERAC